MRSSDSCSGGVARPRRTGPASSDSLPASSRCWPSPCPLGRALRRISIAWGRNGLASRTLPVLVRARPSPDRVLASLGRSLDRCGRLVGVGGGSVWLRPACVGPRALMPGCSSSRSVAGCSGPGIQPRACRCLAVPASASLGCPGHSLLRPSPLHRLQRVGVLGPGATLRAPGPWQISAAGPRPPCPPGLSTAGRVLHRVQRGGGVPSPEHACGRRASRSTWGSAGLGLVQLAPAIHDLEPAGSRGLPGGCGVLRHPGRGARASTVTGAGSVQPRAGCPGPGALRPGHSIDIVVGGGAPGTTARRQGAPRPGGSSGSAWCSSPRPFMLEQAGLHRLQRVGVLGTKSRHSASRTWRMTARPHYVPRPLSTKASQLQHHATCRGAGHPGRDT